MNIKKFKNKLPSLYEDMHKSTHPRSRELRLVIKNVPGMSRENNLKLLNFAVSLLEPGEVYLEIGVWKGLSLLGAMFNNENKEFFAIDDFSEFDGTKKEFFANIKKYASFKNLTFIEGNFKKILNSGFLGDKKIGVFYYDGEHSFSSQYTALKLIQRHLADKALLIVDDANWPWVEAANNLFAQYRNEMNTVFLIQCDYKGLTWWNGVQVLSYNSKFKNSTNSVIEKIQYFVLKERWEKNIIRRIPGLLQLIRSLRRK